MLTERGFGAGVRAAAFESISGIFNVRERPFSTSRRPLAPPSPSMESSPGLCAQQRTPRGARARVIVALKARTRAHLGFGTCGARNYCAADH